MAFVLRPRVAEKSIEAFNNDQRFFWVDDVFITGIKKPFSDNHFSKIISDWRIYDTLLFCDLSQFLYINNNVLSNIGVLASRSGVGHAPSLSSRYFLLASHVEARQGSAELAFDLPNDDGEDFLFAHLPGENHHGTRGEVWERLKSSRGEI